MFKKLQKIGKSFMLPIALLPAAGLLLGIGGALSSEATISAYPVLDVHFLQVIFRIMSAAGNVVFGNLPLLLCVGLCIGLANKDKGVAALAGVVGFLIMTGTTATMLSIFNPEGSAIDTGVIGALVMGSVTVLLHNRYQGIQLPQALGFFGGSRFVPIITSIVAIFVGTAFYLVWPPVQSALIVAGQGIAATGPIGTFFYGFLMRLCGAVGLHHMIYPMFWYTKLGGMEVVAGQTIAGAQKIFFAQLADASHTGLFTEGTKYFAGRFSTMMFGLPGAALAMYHCVKKENRKKYAGLFFGVALTSFLTGITEPLEYMFLFVSPILYVVHSFFDGLAFLAAELLRIRIGNTFSGGFIDFFLFGMLQGNEKSHWLLQLPIGLAWFGLYYFVFRAAILRFNILTPGRDDTEAAGVREPQPTTRSSLAEEAAKILAALGGADNVQDVDACITRLRVSVKDPAAVEKDTLRQLGATAVLEIDGGIQAIYGAKAIHYKSAINDILGVED